METINDRMETLVNERFGGNKAAFSKAIGVSPGFMSSYLGNKRRSRPNLDIVIKIIDTLGVDPYWLLTGKRKEQHVNIGGNNIRYNGTGSNNNNTTTNNYHITGDEKVPKAVNNSPLADKQEFDALNRKIQLMQELIDEKERVIQTMERTIKVLVEKINK